MMKWSSSSRWAVPAQRVLFNAARQLQAVHHTWLGLQRCFAARRLVARAWAIDRHRGAVCSVASTWQEAGMDRMAFVDEVSWGAGCERMHVVRLNHSFLDDCIRSCSGLRDNAMARHA
jgi:hypothetical protein